MPGGFVGVDVFFVISGFLITSILLREHEHNSFSLWKLCQRHIARLFSAFYIVALAAVTTAFFIYSARDLALCGGALPLTRSPPKNRLSIRSGSASQSRRRYIRSTGVLTKHTCSSRPRKKSTLTLDTPILLRHR